MKRLALNCIISTLGRRNADIKNEKSKDTDFCCDLSINVCLKLKLIVHMI
jgi:hypothetical protein